MNSANQKDLREAVTNALYPFLTFQGISGNVTKSGCSQHEIVESILSALAALPSAEEGPTCARCGKPVRHNCPRLGDAAGWVHAHDGSHLCSIPHVAPDGVISPASPSPSERAERAAREYQLAIKAIIQADLLRTKTQQEIDAMCEADVQSLAAIILAQCFPSVQSAGGDVPTK